MRKLVRKVIVDEIKPIENADSIELAVIGGWQCVVRKGEFSPGDTGLYFEIDSALPADDPRYGFLKKSCLRQFRSGDGEVLDECIRIKTAVMRGCVSQGLLMPVKDFPETADAEPGEDCSGRLNVRHYDGIAARYMKSDAAKGPFPSFIPATDEERIQNLPRYFDELKDMEFELTRKVDGSSMTVFYAPVAREDDPAGVCSHNRELDMDDETSAFARTAKKLRLTDRLKESYEENGVELAVQGELNGPGIQKNRDSEPEVNFKAFRIWDITHQRFLTVQERLDWCAKHGVPHVQVIARRFRPFTEFKSMREILEYSDGPTENGNLREGIVYKQEDSAHPVTFKAVSNKYLLKEK